MDAEDALPTVETAAVLDASSGALFVSAMRKRRVPDRSAVAKMWKLAYAFAEAVVVARRPRSDSYAEAVRPGS